MKKVLFVLLAVFVMLIASRFFIRIIDATVQIDDDAMLLILFLTAINTVIGFISYKIYKMTK